MDFEISLKSTYESLTKQHQALLIGRWLPDMANTASFIYNELPNINWAGFYIRENEDLWLGPFMGKPACTQIKIGRGVCGNAAAKQETILVKDVQEFKDHIVCDVASNAEIVVPIVIENAVVGVLDVDAPVVGRFDRAEMWFFEQIVYNLLQANQDNPFLKI